MKLGPTPLVDSDGAWQALPQLQGEEKLQNMRRLFAEEAWCSQPPITRNRRGSSRIRPRSSNAPPALRDPERPTRSCLA
jgi:hypothetical protein